MPGARTRRAGTGRTRRSAANHGRSGSGRNGYVWAAWNGGQWGYFLQDVSVNLDPGDVVTFTIWTYAETGFVSSTYNAYIKLEFWTNAANMSYEFSNSVYSTLVNNYDQWMQLRFVYTNTAGGIGLVKTVVGSGEWLGYDHSAVYFDDATFSVGNPLRVYVGSANLSSTNSGITVHTLTDGALASVTNSTLKLIFEGYDVDSGLARSGQSGYAKSNMNVHVTTLTTNNVTNYVSGSSAPLAGTRSKGATSTWEFLSFSSSMIQSLMDAGTNNVSATLRDADFDRSGDQFSVSNRLYGYLRVTDDDTGTPLASTAAGPAGAPMLVSVDGYYPA